MPKAVCHKSNILERKRLHFSYQGLNCKHEQSKIISKKRDVFSSQFFHNFDVVFWFFIIGILPTRRHLHRCFLCLRGNGFRFYGRVTGQSDKYADRIWSRIRLAGRHACFWSGASLFSLALFNVSGSPERAFLAGDFCVCIFNCRAIGSI